MLSRLTSKAATAAAAGLLPRNVFSQKRLIHVSSYLAKIVQFKLADIGEGIAEVELKEWYVKVGDKVNQFDNVCEVQSDKAAVTITSRFDGVVHQLHHEAGSVVKVGANLLAIDSDSAGEDEPAAKPSAAAPTPAAACAPTPPPTPAAATAPAAQPHPASNRAKSLATPAVRRIAMENRIDINEIQGTGRDGRVLKEDILRFTGAIPPLPGATGAAKTSQTPHLVTGEDKIVPIRGYTRGMIKTMTESLKIPQFGLSDEIGMDAVVKLKRDLKPIAEKKGIRLSYMPIIIKATSLALSEFPILNSSVDDALQFYTYKAAHNICVATDTPGGLVVPNIKNCEQKTVWQIAEDLNRLVELGRKEQLKQDDLTGGTFTLSNIGAVGGTYCVPVVFPPQVAIGGIGRVLKVPRFDDHGNVYPASIMNISWSADHRVIDGATVTRFNNLVKAYLENPGLMMTELR